MSEATRKKATRPDNVGIRLATPDDSAAISEVLRDAFGPFREIYSTEAFPVVTPGAEEIEKRFEEGPQWVAVDDENVVGTVSVTFEPEGLYIRSMAVRPSEQGRGIGHKLLDAIDDYAADGDVKRIFLYTTYFVPGAKELYEKHDFKWVRDTPPEEWYGTPGLEMDKSISHREHGA